MDYYDAGVTTQLIRGFDPLGDALISLVQAEVQHRERQATVVA
ncbi:hypothetical protein [Nostoc flagelliforme]